MLALHPDFDVVIGVDTHNDTHTAAAVGATGAVLEHLTVPADPADYRQLIGFGRGFPARAARRGCHQPGPEHPKRPDLSHALRP